MAFRKFQAVERVEAVRKDESEAIRAIVKEAGAKSASELTDAQRKRLPPRG